jgi:hypothetical protein
MQAPWVVMCSVRIATSPMVMGNVREVPVARCFRPRLSVTSPVSVHARSTVGRGTSTPKPVGDTDGVELSRRLVVVLREGCGGDPSDQDG